MGDVCKDKEACSRIDGLIKCSIVLMWPFYPVFNVINIWTIHALPTLRMDVEGFLRCNIVKYKDGVIRGHWLRLSVGIPVAMFGIKV